MKIKELQERVDAWIREYGVRYFSELTNMACLTEEVGELARVMARKYGDQSFKAGEKENLADEMADVMDASRRAHAFRLKLTAEASDPGIVRMLPPDPLRLPADSADYALPATNRNDR